MSRGFSLAGLLRLRHLQQDIASSEHATANARMRDTALRRARARTDLGDMTVEPQDVAALAAVAAARAAARSTLLELDVLEQAAAEEQERTRVALAGARARSIALEKLAERHDAAVTAEDARVEQHEIDELSSVAWHRDAQALADDTVPAPAGTSASTDTSASASTFASIATSTPTRTEGPTS